MLLAHVRKSFLFQSERNVELFCANNGLRNMFYVLLHESSAPDRGEREQDAAEEEDAQQPHVDFIFKTLFELLEGSSHCRAVMRSESYVKTVWKLAETFRSSVWYTQHVLALVGKVATLCERAADVEGEDNRFSERFAAFIHSVMKKFVYILMFVCFRV